MTRFRWIVRALAVIGLATVFALAGPADAAKTKKHHFTETVIAVSINADGSESVAKITDSVDGPGAGTSKSVSASTNYPFKGTDSNISYFANGVQRSTDTFRIEAPDAHGISKFTGKGRCTGGTGKHKKLEVQLHGDRHRRHEPRRSRHDQSGGHLQRLRRKRGGM